VEEIMSLRASTSRTIGLAVALSLGAAAVAGAQTDTSRTRVPVRKETGTATRTTGVPVTKEPARDTTTRVSTGEVVPPRDTTTVVTPPPQPTPQPAPPPPETTTVTRTDTVFRSLPTNTMRSGFFGNSGFYIGVGGGASVPVSTLSDVGYRTGYNVVVPIGWHKPNNALGVRLDLTFNQIHADESLDANALPAFRGSAPDPKVYGASLDLDWKFPYRNSAGEERWAFYVVGGGGLNMFRGFGGQSPMAQLLGDDIIEGTDEAPEKNVTKWQANAGAGLSWSFGTTSLFLESRFVNNFTSGKVQGQEDVRWVPITVGLTFR
jgi:hypothetical protein